MYKKGDTGEGIVSRVTYPNRGKIYTEEGQRITVKNALPGQKVRFRVTKRRDDKLEARLLEVLALSPDETAPKACDIFPDCGGCLTQRFPYDRQLEIKAEQIRTLLADVIDENTVFDGILPSPSQYAYRNKMEFSFGDAVQGGPLTLGLHRKGSMFDVLDASTCALVHPDLTLILRETLDYCRERELPKYNKKSHTGLLRYLLLRRSESTGEILCYLITSGEGGVSFSDWGEKMKALPLEGSFAGIFHGIDDRFSDALGVERLECLWGRDYFYENLLGLTFKVTAFSFFQTNTRGAEVLYDLVRRYVTGQLGDRRPVLYDLYSGTGTIAQVLAPVAERVYGVEIVEEAVVAARENAALNGLDNCVFLAGDVLKKIDEIEERPDYIVLDPPREGIAPKALAKIEACGVPGMVYISCKATSFVRDMTYLKSRGWRVERFAAVDLFPNTQHVETVCLLTHS